MENPFLTQNKTPQASSLLKTLCVLTFIGSGFNFLANFYYAAFFENAIASIQEIIDSEILESMNETFEASIDFMLKGGAIYYLINTVLYVTSIVGAALMWRLNKIGLHLYIGAQLVLLLIPTLFGLARYPSLFGLLITLLFILFYTRELKRSLATPE